MKFTLTTSGVFYSNEQAEKLKVLGFPFQTFTCPGKTERQMIGPVDEVEVEIGSLEELLAFQKKWGPLIIYDESHLEIYDNHRE